MRWIGTRFGTKNKWLAAFLAFFLGPFGVHKFSLGRYWQGLIMLLCFFPGVLVTIPLIVSMVIAYSDRAIG